MMLMLAMLLEAQRGQKDSFEALFRELYGPVVNIFYKKGCSREDAQDLASETFLRAYRAFGEFRGEARSLTWLHTIADNVWRNWKRDSVAAKRDGIEVPIVEDGKPENAFQDRPRDQTVIKERRRLLKAAIDKLPPKMQRCVWLRVYQHRNYRDIAAILGVTVGTAKSQVSLAQKRLRSLLAEHYPDIDEELANRGR